MIYNLEDATRELGVAKLIDLNFVDAASTRRLMGCLSIYLCFKHLIFLLITMSPR